MRARITAARRQIALLPLRPFILREWYAIQCIALHLFSHIGVVVQAAPARAAVCPHVRRHLRCVVRVDCLRTRYFKGI